MRYTELFEEEPINAWHGTMAILCNSAQDMINAYRGDLYTAMNLDDYLLEQLEAAQAEGYGVDFGNLKDKHADNHWRPAGTFYVVSDPSMLRKAL